MVFGTSDAIIDVTEQGATTRSGFCVSSVVMAVFCFRGYGRTGPALFCHVVSNQQRIMLLRRVGQAKSKPRRYLMSYSCSLPANDSSLALKNEMRMGKSIPRWIFKLEKAEVGLPSPDD